MWDGEQHYIRAGIQTARDVRKRIENIKTIYYVVVIQSFCMQLKLRLRQTKESIISSCENDIFKKIHRIKQN